MKGVLVLLDFLALLFVLALFCDNWLSRTHLIYTRNVSILCIFVYLLYLIGNPRA